MLLTSSTMDFVETVSVVALLLREKSKRRKQRYWVHPLCSQRLMKGHFYTLHEELCDYPRKFFKFYRMSKNTFAYLLSVLETKISYQDTHWRKSIHLGIIFFLFCLNS